MATAPIDRRIDEWKQKLIDPSRRNRLIYFRPSKSSTLSVNSPDAEFVFDRLVVHEKTWKFWMPPPERESKGDPQDEMFGSRTLDEIVQLPFRSIPKQDELVCSGVTRTTLERTIKNIFRKAHTDYQERGVRILYFAFGTLLWKDKEKSDVIRAPLILCPVELARESARDPYILSLAEEETILNPALQVKLLNDFKFRLPEIPEDWDETPLSNYLQAVSRKVKPLDWTVESTALLGLFSFHKLVMYQDLLTNGEQIKEHQVIRALTGLQVANMSDATGAINERELDTLLNPKETFQILDADSSQQQCIQAALQGFNLVLQGPPGTGKSQTIANVIAEFIARGKTVLFVSEKMAALEVVSKRLSDVHLGEFALELHSQKANKREVVAELKRCLDEQLVPKNLPTPTDFEKLKHLRKTLNDYVLALHVVREPLGESVREVLARLATLDEFPLIPTRLDHVEQLRPQRVAEWQELVKRLATIWHVIEEGEDFPWYKCKDRSFTLETRGNWTELLQQLIASIEQLKTSAEEYASNLGIDAPVSLEDITWMIDVGNHLNRSPGADATWLTSPDLQELFEEAERYQHLSEQYMGLRTELRRSYNDTFFDLPSGMADRLRQAWEETARLLARDSSEGLSLVDGGRSLWAFIENTRLSALDWQRFTGELLRHFGMPVASVSLERTENLARLAVLCASEIRPETRWLDPRVLQETQGTVQKARPEYEEYRTQRNDLLTRYNEGIFDLDLDNSLEYASQAVQHPLQLPLHQLSEFVESILSTRLDRSGALSEVSMLLKDLKGNVEEIGEVLGIPTENITVERAREIGRLAELCGTESRPEASWLKPLRLQQVQQNIAKLRPEYAEYNRVKNDLFSRFDESLLELDIDRLIESFGSLLYRAPLRWLNPKYFRDRKAILRTSRTHALPASFSEELLKARELLRTHKRLEPERAKANNLLERYYQDYETDFELIGCAVEVAGEAVRLSRGSGVPEALVKLISFGTTPPLQIPSAAKRILDAVKQWEELAPRFANLIALDDLKKANKSVYRRRWLDTGRERVRALLGSYDRGYETDFDLIEQALKVADEAVRLLPQVPAPEGLVRFITQPSAEASDLAAVGSGILDTVHEWRASTRTLDTFIPETLPGSPLPLIQSSVAEIELWAQSLLSPLERLCDLVELVQSHYKELTSVNLSSLNADLEKSEELIAMQSHLNSEADRLKYTFGVRFSGFSTTWTDILTAIEWTRKMKRIFNGRPMSEEFIQWATLTGDQTPQIRDLIAQHARLAEQLFPLESCFEDPEPTFQGSCLRDLDLTTLLDRVYEIRQRVDDLQPWADFKRVEAQFETSGLAGFLNQLRKHPPPSAELISTFQKSVYQAWVTAVIAEDPTLREFRGRHHEQLIQEFKAVDKKLVRLASQRVIAECNARRPQSVYLQAQDSEIGVLRKEAAKKRKHLPVRHLFDRIPNLLLKLKPCLFMSPLSVSQFLLPERFKFDLVIFDEASQIFTEDAVGAVYRGSQLIVAGDSKQLPPTDFFKSIDTESDDAEENLLDDDSSADFNSVLDECESIPGMSIYSLRWHYRSRHESLIAFSNHHFYHSRLITFPAARHKHKTLGVELINVPDGVYDRGGKRINQREAEVVADRVFEHFAQYPRKSIGVVAFSQAQMAAIEDEIERRRRINIAFEGFFKEDRLEGFFVKNLENVQGDERDVIIFSVGYGRDKDGRITMAFGPLNRQGGERRLNVAITRAREKVLLVSSITASDIDLSATQAAGVLNLYHYLDYAARGEEALQLSSPQGLGEADSPFEEDVACEVRSLGYDAIPQVGCSGFRVDIGVLDPAEPGRFLLGVECDGATYHSAATARDRDRLRQQILEMLGWRIHRIWSPDWVIRRDLEIRILKEAIETARHSTAQNDELTALIADDDSPDTNQQVDVERVAVVQPEAHAALPGTVPYEVCALGFTRYNGNEFHYPQYRKEQSELLAKVVSQEGPIHIELATRRVLASWRLTRAGVRIVEAMTEAIRMCERKSLLRKQGDFLWPRELSDVPVRVPVQDMEETYRDVAHIPSEEIRSCMLLIVYHSVGIGVESLIKETANVFGFNRTGDRIRDRLFNECKALQRKHALLNIDGSLSLNEDEV